MVNEDVILGFALGVVAIVISNVIKEALSKIVSKDPKKLGWLGFAVAGIALWYTSYRTLSILLIFFGILWLIILTKAWRGIKWIKKSKRKSKK